ncbi:MAG: hypothetical protein LBD53_06260, partial [Tannerella sp.]|nr:hypothetical protein [Tannerella sp.]
MKKLVFIMIMALTVIFVNTENADAQIHVSVNIDIQPAWGPMGHDYVEYYYIPEIDVYYDVINRLFYYPHGNRWIPCTYLPVAYSYYDFYSLYKVVLNNIFDPWRYHIRHRQLYAHYCYNYHQMPIYCSRDHRYHHARINYRDWVETRHMPANNGRPYSRDFARNSHNARVSNDRGRATT